jgi:exodeoxyribonuclease V gamma subunit
MREMPGLYLHTSNHLETLFEDQLAVVRKPLPFVLQPEIIVVQSLGMGRWLSLQLAKQQGICANVQFPFPRRFLADVFRMALPETPEGKHFDRQTMTWRLMHVLPQMVERPEFEAVRNYIKGEQPGLKRFQLASKIAEAFNQYIAFRPQYDPGLGCGEGKPLAGNTVAGAHKARAGSASAGAGPETRGDT